MALWVLALLGPCAEAAVFRVGSDAACTHATIQAAIDAAAANGSATLDSIRVARNGSYLAQALVIDSQRVLLSGGYADCTATTRDLPSTVLDGDGNGGHPILEFRSPGSARQLLQITALELRGGHVQTGDGGALRISGNAQVDLGGISVHENSARKGGAIHIRGNSPTETLDLNVGSDSVVDEPFRAENNVADLGGAIYVDDNARLGIVDARIAANHARCGGGIYVGPGGEGGISFGIGDGMPIDRGIQANSAELDGGGVYINSGKTFFIVRYGPSIGYWISGNEAGRDGGGVHVVGPGSRLIAYGLRLDGNVAGALEPGRGGGGYAASGGGIILRGDSGGGKANYCLMGTACASVSRNHAGINGHSGKGGGLFVDTGGLASLLVGEMRDNESLLGSAGMVAGIDAALTVDSALVTGNFGGEATLQANSGASLDLLGITLTGDAGSGPLLGVADAQLSIIDSIVHQPDRVVASITGTSTISTDCVISHENFHPSGDVRVADPGFIDEWDGEFGLRLNSAAVDACSHPTLLNSDASNNPRGVDLHEIPNTGGPFDAGAFERQTGDTLFLDGFDALAR